MTKTTWGNLTTDEQKQKFIGGVVELVWPTHRAVRGTILHFDFLSPVVSFHCADVHETRDYSNDTPLWESYTQSTLVVTASRTHSVQLTGYGHIVFFYNEAAVPSVILPACVSVHGVEIVQTLQPDAIVG